MTAITLLDSRWLAFAIMALVIELTPGPNMAYLAALSLSQGARAGFAAVGGVALGLSVYGVAAALGLGALIGQSPVMYEGLRWAGVAYLFWLAWDAWTSERDEARSRQSPDISPRMAFRRGLITNLLNPKAAVFYIAVLPDFIAVEGGGIAAQTIALAAVYVGVATAVHLFIVVLAGQSHRLIATAEQRRKIRRILAVVLAVVAIWFAFSTARP